MALIPLLLIVLLAVAVATRTWTRVGRTPNAARFLTAHELPHTDDARWLAHTFLWRERWWRLAGAWAGFIVVAAYGSATRDDFELGIPHLAGVIVGSAVGVAWAARPPRRPQGATREASLAARAVDDYLTRRARAVEAVAAGLIATTSGVVAIVAFTRDATTSALSATACCLAGALGFVAIRALQRRVVEAARPPLHGRLAATDDARRASTVQSLHHALLAGLCCLGIFLVGSTAAVANPVEVRFDGRVVHRAEGVQSGWSVGTTPEGGLVLWPGNEEDDAVTVRPPASARTEGGAISVDRWEVEGATGHADLRTLGTPTNNVFAVLLVAILAGAAIAEWSRIRRAPYEPLVRHPGPRRSESARPVTTTARATST